MSDKKNENQMSIEDILKEEKENKRKTKIENEDMYQNVEDDDINFSGSQDITYDEEGNILKSVSDIFHESMLPYSEYVILDRALPRVEDGLKPVQRRILYSMNDIGLSPDKPYKKSAKVVGDVIGNYHPHGDSSVYGAMVRLAQPFNMRETLVDGHGNFGSVDGDGAAAMRYTEARLAPLALEMLKDIEKDTVKWSFNYDDTRYEPDMLPSRFPNLLVNGSNGIAVGLATNFPTHNLGESIDACCAYIDNPEISLPEIMNILKGPDFPTGGIVLGYDELVKAYETGKGKITVRSKTEIVDAKSGKKDIVITEFPYQVNKSACLLKISELKEANKEILAGIADIRDESDKEGIRAVIQIKAGYDAQKILNYLLKYSDLQVTFGINMVAIAEGKPQLLNLKSILKYYTEYQRQVVYNRTNYDLEAAKERAHILEGLIIAITNIDEVVKIIKNSSSTAIAKVNLCTEFELDDRQAQAILDMRLGRLTSLEVEKLQNELLELNKLIARLAKIIASVKLQYDLVKKEMLAIKAKFKSARKSQIVKNDENLKLDISIETPPEDCIVCIGQKGNIKRMGMKSYNMTGRVVSETTNMNEVHSHLVSSTTDSTIYMFTNLGNCVILNVKDIPEAKWKERGAKIKDLALGLGADEYVVSAFSYKGEIKDGIFNLYTSDGYVKKVEAKEYQVKKQIFPALKLRENATLVNVELEKENKSTIFYVTMEGMALRSNKEGISLSSRLTTGIKGMSLNEDDKVIFARSVKDDDKIIVMTSKGYLKQVEVKEFEILLRARKGLKITVLNADTGNKLIYVDILDHKKEIYLITDKFTYSVPNTSIPVEERVSKGKILIKGLKQQKIKNVYRYEWDIE